MTTYISNKVLQTFFFDNYKYLELINEIQTCLFSLVKPIYVAKIDEATKLLSRLN